MQEKASIPLTNQKAALQFTLRSAAYVTLLAPSGHYGATKTLSSKAEELEFNAIISIITPSRLKAGLTGILRLAPKKLANQKGLKILNVQQTLLSPPPLKKGRNGLMVMCLL